MWPFDSSDCLPCPTDTNYGKQTYMGHGAHGIVTRAQHNVDRQPCTLKYINLPKEESSRNRIINEAILIATLMHKHVLRYFESWTQSTECRPPEFFLPGLETKEDLCIRTELCCGTLSEFLRQDLIIDFEQRLRLAIELTKGVKYLHEKNVTHGDLHAGNVFLDFNRCIKIGDFGHAIKHEKRELAGAPDEEFETRRIQDVKWLIRLVIELLVPFVRDPENECQIYRKKRHDFINQDITSPNLDKAVKSCILRIWALLHPQNNVCTADKVLYILQVTWD